MPKSLRFVVISLFPCSFSCVAVLMKMEGTSEQELFILCLHITSHYVTDSGIDDNKINNYTDFDR